MRVEKKVCAMKDKYREETNKDVYSNDVCCGCGGSDGSYSVKV